MYLFLNGVILIVSVGSSMDLRALVGLGSLEHFGKDSSCEHVVSPWPSQNVLLVPGNQTLLLLVPLSDCIWLLFLYRRIFVFLLDPTVPTVQHGATGGRLVTCLACAMLASFFLSWPGIENG